MSIEETLSAAQQLYGDVAPKLADMTDDLLFGDIWERSGLAKRDRSLITVATLAAQYRIEQLPFHIGKASTLASRIRNWSS